MISKRPLTFPSALAGLLLMAFPAAAQSSRTEVVTIAPPADWVLSVWQGGTIELGEFTPAGQTGGQYIDLLGYSAIPLAGTDFGGLDDLLEFERQDAAKECRSSQYVERPAAQGWVSLARVCIGGEGAAPDTAELEFATTTLTDQAVYRIWRTHRAPFADIAASAGMADTTADTLDAGRFAHIVEAWAPLLAPDLERRGICDLESLVGCEAFPERLPEDAESRFRGNDYVVGAWLFGENRITRERFLEVFQAADDGSPNQVFAILDSREADWGDAESMGRLLTMIAYGQAADGALLGITDAEGQLSSAERALIRANVIQNLRRLVRPDAPIPAVVIAIPRP